MHEREINSELKGEKTLSQAINCETQLTVAHICINEA